jgi:sulfur carrier protein ThiS
VSLEPGATVSDLIDALGITRRVIVSVNDSSEAEAGDILQEEDEVAIYSIIGGGTK